MSKTRYQIVFYTLVDKQGDFESYQGDTPVVCVGISTNPIKYLHQTKAYTKKDVFVMLVAPCTNESYVKLLQDMEELNAYRNWYFLQELSPLIKRKCKEHNFTPYKIRAKKHKQSEVDNPLAAML